MKRLFLAVILFAVSMSVFGQQLKVATGGPKGTYSTMLKELNAQCSETITLTELNTSGSNENVTLLIGNQINAAIVQTDVLYYRAKTEDLSNVKTLLALHPEEVHVISLRDTGKKKGAHEAFGVSVGGEPLVFSSVSDLAGYKLGAAGGSVITAQYVRMQAEIAYNVVQFNNNDDVIKALTAGTIDAALMVVGAPSKDVQGLKGNFKILPFSESSMGKLKDVYRPARLNYANLNAQGITTVATDALLVTRDYKTARMLEALSKFRACALAKIDDLKETLGTHPKWQSVDVNNHGKWLWYELSGVVKK